MISFTFSVMFIITITSSPTITSGLMTMSPLNLTLLHTNDVHARFEQFNKYGGSCSDSDSIAGKCYGGVARRMTAINQLRERHNNTLLLDAGDQFQGTLWFFMYKGQATSHFTNILKYDAMALGNHEFDNNIEGLEPFLKNTSFPILSCNINASLEPSIDGLINKSITKLVGGIHIGIVGYTTKETTFLSSPGRLVFEDEIVAVQREVDNLKRRGVNIIIALGHAGIGVDKAIAMNVNGVDVVIGGHSNTFLYTGTPPSIEEPYGDYPYVVTQNDGNKVLVVQDYTFGKYLGELNVEFDENGHVSKWKGNPILLDNSYKEDNITLYQINEWKRRVEVYGKHVIGKTNVFLDTTKCRISECNIGNMFTDALIHQNLKHPDGIHWTRASISIWNGGAFRAPIQEGDITIEDVLTTSPFRNGIDVVEIKGKYVKEVFEHGVSKYNKDAPPGAFLQVSGVIVTYDLSKATGSRVLELELRCAKCRIPQYEPLEEDKVYTILVSSFLVGGGDGYAMLKKAEKRHILGDLDSDIIIEYITATSPIFTGLERRIRFIDDETNKNKTIDNLCLTTGGTDLQVKLSYVLPFILYFMWILL